MQFNRDDAARAAMGEVLCPACGNSSAVDEGLPWRDRPPTHAGINVFYNERVYHNVEGDFRGQVVMGEEGERCDAPDASWVLECCNCRHEWPLAAPGQSQRDRYTDWSDVKRVVTYEFLLASLSETHHPAGDLPVAQLRAGDVIYGKCEVTKVCGDPVPESAETIRVTLARRVFVTPTGLGWATDTYQMVYRRNEVVAVCRLNGPPPCLKADLVALLETTRFAAIGRLAMVGVVADLKERFTLPSIRDFFGAFEKSGERRWELLKVEVDGPARAIDL